MARSRRRGGRGLLRALNLLPFLPLAGRAPLYTRLLWALAADPRVPMARKALLGLAGAYIVSPFDIIPDRLPFVGALDDVAVMVLAIDVFLEGLPEELVAEKLDALGIPPSELESDLARVRQLVPRPVRALAARVPDAIDGISRFVTDNGIDVRLRELASRSSVPQAEESPA